VEKLKSLLRIQASPTLSEQYHAFSSLLTSFHRFQPNGVLSSHNPEKILAACLMLHVLACWILPHGKAYKNCQCIIACLKISEDKTSRFHFGSKAKVTFRPTVSQSVRPCWCRAQPNVTVRQLRFCRCEKSSLTRGRVYHFWESSSALLVNCQYVHNVYSLQL
jgi:hypothetical protein